MATPITVGQTINGTLTTSDCASPSFGEGSFADRYSFSGTAGQQVIVQATSGEIAPFLYLLASGGAVLDAAYTGTGVARLPSSGVQTLQTTGTYIIEILAGGQPKTGTYAITLGNETLP